MKKSAWKALITVAIIAVIPGLLSNPSTSQPNHLISQARPKAQLIYTLKAHKDRVSELAISPDGKGDNSVVESVFVSRDGKMLASSSGNIIKIWRLSP